MATDTYKREAQIMETLIHRFTIDQDDNIYLDHQEITMFDLVNLANQLASALNDRGCYFEVENITYN